MQPRRLRYKKSMPAPAPANVTISVALCLGVKCVEVDNNLTPSHQGGPFWTGRGLLRRASRVIG